MEKEEITEVYVVLPSFGAVKYRQVYESFTRLAAGVPTRADVLLVAECLAHLFGRL